MSEAVSPERDDGPVALLRTPSTPDADLTIGELAIVAGPDAGRRFPLAVGQAVIGRAASCEIPVRDADIEPHHVLVDVDVSGIVRLTQLTGRQPMLVDRRPTATAALANTGAHIELGATRLEWRTAGLARVPHPVSDQPLLGYVDASDRAFGIDAASPNRLPGHLVSLPVGTRQLCVVGSDIGAIVRGIVGQCAQSGWSVQSSFAGAACSVGGGSRSVVVADRTDRSPNSGRLDGPAHLDETGQGFDDADLIVHTIDGVVDGDEVDQSELGSAGSVIIVGERCRGRYVPDVNEFATTRLHLVGWHPTTFTNAVGVAARVRDQPQHQPGQRP